MATPNPWTITLGTFELGGASSSYLLNGPYVIDRSYQNLRLVFEVVVVATSTENLYTLCTDLEQACSARDIGFSIDYGGGDVQVFLVGSQLLNPTASISKRGDPETDQGFSRAYSITLEAGFASGDTAGLRDVSFSVTYTPARRRSVLVQGVYTSTGSSAAANYLSNADGVITPILDSLGGTWELLTENYTPDRNNHTATFERTYLELTFPESDTATDNPFLVDARISFSLSEQQPGDSIEGTYRLARVTARIDAWVDIEKAAAVNDWPKNDPLQSVYTEFVRDYLLQLFEENFEPQVFGIEAESIQVDRSESRVTASMQLIYQSSSGSAVIEVAESLAYQENRQLDYTPIHSESGSRELSMFVDPGWLIVERIVSRTVRVVGNETPKFRIAKESGEGPAGPLNKTASSREINESGWNRISNTSNVITEWIGKPDNQFQVTTLTEKLVERYNVAPVGTSSSTTPLEPSTPVSTGSTTGGPATGGQIPGGTGNA